MEFGVIFFPPTFILFCFIWILHNGVVLFSQNNRVNFLNDWKKICQEMHPYLAWSILCLAALLVPLPQTHCQGIRASDLCHLRPQLCRVADASERSWLCLRVVHAEEPHPAVAPVVPQQVRWGSWKEERVRKGKRQAAWGERYPRRAAGLREKESLRGRIINMCSSGLWNLDQGNLESRLTVTSCNTGAEQSSSPISEPLWWGGPCHLPREWLAL